MSNPFLKSASKNANPFLRAGRGLSSFYAEPEVEYSAVRSGAVDFLESAIGVGDELDATIRVLSGEADNYSQGIQQSRAELDAFEKANPNASGLITAVGLGAGLFIPGAGLVKIAQTGSKLDRAFKVATLGAAEGAAYGYLSGRDEGRLEGAAMGAALGGGLGAAASTLTRNADEIAAAAKQAKRQGGRVYWRRRRICQCRSRRERRICYRCQPARKKKYNHTCR